MLSRVADSLIWLSRYLVRVEALSRLVEETEQLALDYQHPKLSDMDSFWRPLVSAYGYPPEVTGKLATVEEVIGFLAFDRENPGSVLSSLGYARENARGVRDQLGNELWEALNDLYLWCRDQSWDPSSHFRNFSQFGGRVRQGCLNFYGLVSEVMPRNETWCFMRLGNKLERADQTSRLLDLRTFMPGGENEEDHAFEPYVWLSIMRGCGAGARRGFGNTEADWPRMIETLIYSTSFPRSIRYCVGEVDSVLHRLSGTPEGAFANPAERASGELAARLSLLSYQRDLGEDLHDFLDGVQKDLARIGDGINRTYTHLEEAEEEEEEEPEEQSQSQ